MFYTHTQYINPESGFHVMELRDEHGARHLVQIAIGHDSCPACGHLYPKSESGEIDPKAAAAAAAEALNHSRERMLAYAARHGVRVAPVSD